MKNLILIILTIFLSACGKSKLDNPTTVIVNGSSIVAENIFDKYSKQVTNIKLQVGDVCLANRTRLKNSYYKEVDYSLVTGQLKNGVFWGQSSSKDILILIIENNKAYVEISMCDIPTASNSVLPYYISNESRFSNLNFQYGIAITSDEKINANYVSITASTPFKNGNLYDFTNFFSFY
jgi:hypothetical protein